MRTRQIDYSDEQFQINRYIQELVSIMNDYKNKQHSLSPVKRVQHLNSLTLFNLTHMDILNIQDPKWLNSFEKLYKVCLSKKATYEIQMKEMSTELGGDTPEFQKASQKLIQTCATLNQKIREYFNRKYSVVLIKTNRDIYRNILSFL